MVINSTLRTLAHAQFLWCACDSSGSHVSQDSIVGLTFVLLKKIHSSRMSAFRTNGGIIIWHLYESPTTFFSLLLPHIFAGREHHAATVAVRCENIRNFHSCAIPVKPTLFPHFLPNRFLVRDLPLAGQVRSLSHCPQSSGSAILGCWTLVVLCISTNCQCNFHVRSQLSRARSKYI